MSRLQRFTLVAAILVVLGNAIAWLQNVMAPDFPHFWRFLLFFTAVKILGDAVYFILWPHRREWAFLSIYFWDDFFTFFRFAFPGAVVQRLIETHIYPPYIYDSMPQSLPHQIVVGPYLAIAVYLVNRWLVEEASEERYHQARDFLHLP